MMDKSSEFYNRQYEKQQYGTYKTVEEHHAFKALNAFICAYNLSGMKCLEVGGGRGLFQDCVHDYVAIDIANTVKGFFFKPFCQASAKALPFQNNSFDVVWSLFTLEHVFDPEPTIVEMRRVLVNKGYLFLYPAWKCPSWFADGYPVRPYSDFGWKGKIIKASIPLRKNVMFRSMTVIPRRVINLSRYYKNRRRPVPLRYRKIKPNYDFFWMPDSDAVNWLDPFDFILWFISRGDKCLNYTTLHSQLLVRTDALIFQVNK